MSEIYQVATGSVAMTGKPDGLAEASSELLYGESFHVTGEQGDFVKGVCLTDGYEGYIPRAALSENARPATHKLKALRSYVYPAPDFKAPPLAMLPFLARLSLTGEEQEGFAEIADGGWIWAGDVCETGEIFSDYVQTARRFIETPYLWGGRTSLGLDCSALVQLALLAAGIPCPRDSKDQEKAFGRKPSANPRPGDLVFFRGHVGIMIDDKRLISATCRTMTVSVEDLDTLTESYQGITAAGRPE